MTSRKRKATDASGGESEEQESSEVYKRRRVVNAMQKKYTQSETRKEHTHDDALCLYCQQGGADAHPLFVFMASINEDGAAKGVNKHISSIIGVSVNPLKRIQEENRIEGFAVGSKVSQKGAPYWQPELVIGPFTPCSRSAKRFKENWRRDSRKLARRIRYGVEKAAQEDLFIYARDSALIEDIVKSLPTDDTSADQEQC